MPSKVSIRERIVREVKRRIDGATGVGTCHRFDQRGNNLAISDALIKAEFDRATEGSLGGNADAITLKTMNLSVFVRVNQAEDDTVSTDEKVNQLVNAIETAIMADPTITEPDTLDYASQLARDTSCTLAGYAEGQELESGLVEVMAGVEFEIEYEHYRNDPCNGPSIEELQE